LLVRSMFEGPPITQKSTSPKLARAAFGRRRRSSLNYSGLGRQRRRHRPAGRRRETARDARLDRSSPKMRWMSSRRSGVPARAFFEGPPAGRQKSKSGCQIVVDRFHDDHPAGSPSPMATLWFADRGSQPDERLHHPRAGICCQDAGLRMRAVI
jgi:hypothetical protein